MVTGSIPVTRSILNLAVIRKVFYAIFQIGYCNSDNKVESYYQIKKRSFIMKLKIIIIMALCLSFVMTCGVFLAACNKGGGEGGGDTYVPRNSN